MTERYVIWLRGINVGRNKRIAMADLRGFLEELGFTDVATILQSGNAVVTAPHSATELEAAVTAGIETRFGMQVHCLVRTGDEVRAVIATNPLAVPNGSRFYGLFLSAAPDPKLLAAHDPIALDPERAVLGDRVIYHWCPDGILEAPPLIGLVERELKIRVTARNWNTIAKVAAKL